MSKKKLLLPHEREQNKLNKDLHYLIDLFQADSLHNLIQKIESTLNTLKKLEETINEMKEDICSLVSVKGYGNARRRIISLSKKTTQTVAEKYQLDTTFLNQVGERWDRTGSGKNDLQMLRSLEEKISYQRSRVTEIYHNFLQEVVAQAGKAGYTEWETREEVEAWSAQFQEDFHAYSVVEMWEEYFGKYRGISVLPVPEERIPLSEALPLVQDYSPKRLYEDLLDARVLLGNVSRFQFEKWETMVTKSHGTDTQEMLSLRRKVMRSVVGIALHRLALDTDGVPDPEQENALTLLLSTPDECPYAQEFAIDDSTSLLQFTSHYNHYITK